MNTREPEDELDGLDSEQLKERVRQLETALSSRVIIEQAKGVICGRTGMAPEEAFYVLRMFSRSNNRSLHDVADAIVSGREWADWPAEDASRSGE